MSSNLFDALVPPNYCVVPVLSKYFDRENGLFNLKSKTKKIGIYFDVGGWVV